MVITSNLEVDVLGVCVEAGRLPQSERFHGFGVAFKRGSRKKGTQERFPAMAWHPGKVSQKGFLGCTWYSQ